MGKSLGRTRHWVSSPTYRATIEVIVAARHESGLTQKALADRLGKPPSYVAKIELVERRLDVVEFIAICRVFGVAPDALMARIASGLPENLDF